jgi:hypothetical protein
VNPGSGTGIPVLRSFSTVIPVLKKSAGIANPTWSYVLILNPKDPWFKPQSAQKTEIFFQKDPFQLPKFLRADPDWITELQKSQLYRNFYGLFG